MISSQSAIRGAEKAAIVMLAVGETHSVNLFTRLADAEVKEISEAMAGLEQIDAHVVENVLAEFAGNLPPGVEAANPPGAAKRIKSDASAHRGYSGQYETTRAGTEDSSSASVWSELDHIDSARLANYLENEHPQTAAVVLARLDRTQAASVLAKLPDDFAADVIDRMISTDGVKSDILSSVEETLKREFVKGPRDRTSANESLATVVELLDKLDPAAESKFLENLSRHNRAAAKRIRDSRFAFGDLERLDASTMARVALKLDPSRLALATQGSIRSAS